MSLIIIATLLFSHAIAAYPFISNLQRDKMPNTSHFAVISVILYYDIGLVIETLGLSVGNEYFIPFFDAKPSIVLSASILMTLAPWMFILGSQLTNKENGRKLSNNFSYLRESTKPLFYAILVLVCIYLSVTGVNEIMQDVSLWGSRDRITEKWGAFVLVLYLPLHFLAFYTRQAESSSKNGLIFSIGLTVATILSTIGIAQRTNMLLPILMLALFRQKISLQKIVISVAILLITASVLLPFFKWQKQDSQDISSSIGVLIAETIETDFYRGGVLVSTLDKTEVVGTKIMPYAMAGYVYSLLYYVPREIAPFKGWSTSQTFTAIVDKTRVEDTKWGFGVGVIEELLLNIGLVLSIPCLFVYGMIMGMIDKASLRVPSLLIPTRLGAIWLCGYESSVLLFIFGTMALVALMLHMLFVQKPTNKDLKIKLYKQQESFSNVHLKQ
jgi:hypothetical protein